MEIKEIKYHIKRNQGKIYRCCGTKLNLCLRCFDLHHKIEDLKKLKKFINAYKELCFVFEELQADVKKEKAKND